MNVLRYLMAALVVGMVSVAPSRAQWRDDADTIKLPRWEPHLSAGTGFVGSSYGDNRLFTSIAPSLTFRPNGCWTVNAGFRVTTDMGLNPNYAFSSAERSLAPYRHRNGGTGLVSVHAGAQYRANDRLWLAASVYHLTGTYAPYYGFGNGDVFDVSATAFSAAASYRFGNDSFLHLSVTCIRDEYGTVPFLWHDAWMHGGYGSWGMYGSPYGQTGFGGWW